VSREPAPGSIREQYAPVNAIDRLVLYRRVPPRIQDDHYKKMRPANERGNPEKSLCEDTVVSTLEVEALATALE